jgi:hypothetical protein
MICDFLLSRITFSRKTVRTPQVSSLMRPEILLTPPLLAKQSSPPLFYPAPVSRGFKASPWVARAL